MNVDSVRAVQCVYLTAFRSVSRKDDEEEKIIATILFTLYGWRSQISNWNWSRLFADKQLDREQMINRQNQVHIFFSHSNAYTHSTKRCTVYIEMKTSTIPHPAFSRCSLCVCVYSVLWWIHQFQIGHQILIVLCLFAIEIQTGCTGWFVGCDWQLSRSNIQCNTFSNKQFYLLAPSQNGVFSSVQFSWSKLTMATLTSTYIELLLFVWIQFGAFCFQCQLNMYIGHIHYGT